MWAASCLLGHGDVAQVSSPALYTAIVNHLRKGLAYGRAQICGLNQRGWPAKALSKLHDAEHGPAGWMWPQVNKTNSIKSGLTPYLSAPRPVPPSKGFGFPESQAEPLPPSNHAEAIRHTKMESYLDNLTVSDITQLVGEGCLILELLS